MTDPATQLPSSAARGYHSAPPPRAAATQATRPGTTWAAAVADERVRRDLRLLARFISIYCHGRHRRQPQEAVVWRELDVAEVVGQPVVLCAACRRLLIHAFVKRIRCPLDPKPACKRCPQHCYASEYRQRIREVMRYAGWRMVLFGRLDYLGHLLWSRGQYADPRTTTPSFRGTRA
ncbi:MAG TPA: nitrous oxide-stimulated promoter family protein [Phycisphaerae bacterium]|nr:nitrous oxide-stimulated promoter family protein [Phycisphaerae bacterium]HNU44494.1 nitrous oxide-stimulated promoter family protein [Phycisphaerae bacterium]